MCWRRCTLLNIQVRVAVQVHTKSTVRYVMSKSKSVAQAHPSLSASRQRRNPTLKRNSLSTILTTNSLLLLLLALCCDVCKSNEYPIPTPPEPSDRPDHLNFDLNGSTFKFTNSTIPSERTTNTSPTTTTTATHFDGVDFVALLESITREGLQRCIAEENLFVDEFGIKCDTGDTNEKCYRTRCIKGYEQWWRALKEFEPCQEACTSMQFHPYDLPCISACESAQRQYWRAQRHAMEPTVRNTKPRLLIEPPSEAATLNTLSIQWPIVFPDNYELAHLASRPFNIQYQYAKASNDTSSNAIWSNLADYNCNEDFECEILEGLVAFTSYRFRFELPFGDTAEDVLYSPATDVYTTPAAGTPISSPVINKILSLDESHVALFWETGRFTNGLLKGFKLNLQTENDSIEIVMPPNLRQNIIANLTPNTNYSLQFSLMNDEGDGPAYESYFITKDIPKSLMRLEDLKEVIIAGDYSIKLKSLEPSGETRLIFKSDVILGDCALYAAEQRFFILDPRGKIYSFLLSGENTGVGVPIKKQDLRPKRLSIDWLNQRLFIAGETSPSTWLVFSIDFDGNNEEVFINNLQTGTMQQLEVDPFNGWLFWTDTNGLRRLDMATKEFITIVKDNKSQIGYFTNDYKRYLLTLYNKTDGKLYESSYDGAYYVPVQWSLWNQSAARTQLLHGELLSFQYDYESNLLVANNGTHLVRQNYHTNENDVWETQELEWCWQVWALQLRQQHLPQPHSPGDVNAVLDSHMARISWTAPVQVSSYQSPHAAWQHWEYELEIMDVASNSAFNIRGIETKFFNVERLQANNLYKLRVRVASSVNQRSGGSGGGGNSGEGPWSEELLTRTWPLGEHKFIWVSNGSTETGAMLYETNEFGHQLTAVRALVGVETVRDFIQLNGTIYYLSDGSTRRLACANIMNPEVNCSFVALEANSLAYDWRGGKLYWTDVLRNCVVRANLDGSEWELLPILGAQYIKLDAYNGHIYYMTPTKLARRSLSGSRVDIAAESEYFHVNGGFGGQMRGFALDLTKQYLYWIVRQNEGRVRLFRTSLDRQHKGKSEDLLLAHDIVFGSLNYLQEVESLMWLKAYTNEAILMRTDKLHLQGVVRPEGVRNAVTAVLLKTEITPYMDESVVPVELNRSTVRIEDGFWDDFNIKWSPITTAENYTVYYKVLLEHLQGGEKHVYTREVIEPFVRVTELKQPAVLLNITITPHTYWRSGVSTQVQLSTPAATPTQPKRLRVFVERLDLPLQATSNITALIRWDAPENITKSNDVAYKVYCWLGEQLHSARLHNITTDGQLEAVVDNLQAGETYTFQVQAFIAGRERGGEKTAFHALHINPEVQAVPRLLIATSEYIAVLDLDLKTQKVLVHTPSQVEHLASMHGEQRLLWVNENVELMSYVPGAVPVKLARMRAEVLALTVDWIARVVYWAEMATEVEQAVSIYKLELCLFEGRVRLGTKLLTTLRGRLLKDLTVLPFSQTLLWLEFELGMRNATLVGRNLTDLSVLELKSMPGLRRMFAGSLTADEETVNLIDHKQKLCFFDVQRQLCTLLKSNALLDDTTHMDRDNGYFYILKNETIRAYNRRKLNLEYIIDVADVRSIKAFNFQAYPERKCLLPEEERLLNKTALLSPIVVDVDEDFMTVAMPPVNSYTECKLPQPGLRYSLQLRNDQNMIKNFTSYGHVLNITELVPFTNYSLELQVTSYYQQRLDLPLLKAEPIVVHTLPGVPGAAQNFTAYALSPTEIEVSWAAPEVLNCAEVWYELHWQLENSSLVAHKRIDVADTHMLTNLVPGQQYTVWLQIYSTPRKFNITAAIDVNTFEQPSPLELLDRTAYNLTLSWIPTNDVDTIILVCRSLNSAEENEFSLDITKNTTNIVVTDLEPKTRYEIFLELRYEGVQRPYLWPEHFNDRYIYETLGDCPGSPGKPNFEYITGEIFKVFWDPARNNGAPIEEYSLEALQAHGPRRVRREAIDMERNASSWRNNTVVSLFNEMLSVDELEPIEDKWLVQCNTTELSCIVREMHTKRLQMFRVRARNALFGWGPYSKDSERIFEPYVSTEKRNSLIFAIIAPAAIVSSCVIALVIIRKVQRRRLKNKKLLEKSRPSIWSNLSTLQQQQLMTTRSRTFSLASHSTINAVGPLSDADIALLPHISWNQITLQNFLGSGAFGEVYEGLVKYEETEEQEKVAIKSLRKGSSEFAELLQEAQLMSNFKHENIVRLIGVCFDMDFISIIMEHMEGGDLLTYLRESRPNSNKPVASLQLLDLMTMCIDVANGCAYLEDMHFVHRDLACRNCLVSSTVPSKRTVKIGDFGLARDIYKSDYYRKEGEGLLPVRWMSPESLVDGLFTTQSDVWAFAVLCWEILTLGQQPYAARNNFEVLNFVKDDGRLEQPDNCPDKFFQLMLQCWHTDPEERPSFRKCVNTLLAIKTDVRRVSLGYNMDDSDYAMYANQHGIYMSTFLARPLPKVEEEPTDADSKSLATIEPSSIESQNYEKAELRVRFQPTPTKEIDFETASDESQFIENGKIKKEKVEKDEVEENIYANEGVSRL